jgi:hypothetical protein
MVIKRVSPLSAAKVAGVLYAGLGLVIGACISIFSMVMGAAMSGSNELPSSPLFGMLFGAGALIAAPIFYGIMGLIGGAIGALLYNLAAGIIGGLEIDVQ